MTAGPADREAARIARRIARPRIWQYDFLMLEEIAAALRREAAALNGSSSMDVLDVGCKVQPYRSFFAERTGRYVGLDRARWAGVSVIADAARLPFPDDSYDLVLCTQTLYQVRDFRAALAECVRVLRGNGRLLLTTIGVWPYPPEERVHRFSRRELEELLSEFGEARVEESGGYLRIVPLLANTALAMGVERYLRRRWGTAGRVVSAPCKGVYAAVNLAALAAESLVRSAARAGSGLAESVRGLDPYLAVNYLAVVTPRKRGGV
jgi:SAM-dependent methyltransferase